MGKNEDSFFCSEEDITIYNLNVDGMIIIRSNRTCANKLFLKRREKRKSMEMYFVEMKNKTVVYNNNNLSGVLYVP